MCLRLLPQKEWAATLDEESARLHKQQVAMAQELLGAAKELEQTRAMREASPTPSEQVRCAPLTAWLSS